MKSAEWLKLIFIFVAFLESFFMGLLPIKVKKCKESPSILGIANAFAGGVFIAIALMHIMPEQISSYNSEICGDDPDGKGCEDGAAKFPLPYLLVVVGYTVILVLDKVIFDAHSMLHGEDEAGHMHSHDHKEILRVSMTRASMTMRNSIK